MLFFEKGVFPKGVQSLRSLVPFLNGMPQLESLSQVCGDLMPRMLSPGLWDQHCLTELEIRWRIIRSDIFFEKGQAG